MNCPKCNNEVKKSKHSSPKYQSYRCFDCNSLWDISDLIKSENTPNKILKFGDTVFHVEHPNVKAVVISEGENKNNRLYHKVVFEKEISFRGNPSTKDSVYFCNQELLYTSQEEAKKNNKPF